MIQSRGRVPNFSLKPHPGLMIVMGFVLVIGLLGALSFYSRDDGTGVYAQKGTFILIVTGIVTLCLLIAATSKLWFTHLWKKNSTHKRHHQHSRHHPVNRNKKSPKTNNS